MAKVAIFVEGDTEAELTTQLLISLCGMQGIEIELQKQHGGKLHFYCSRGDSGARLTALVANCATDGQVKTQICDRYTNLVNAGYTRIVGIRDVHPHSRLDIPKLEMMKNLGLPAGSVPVELHYAVMEVEAWFLDEITHFERVHPNLTPTRLAAAGFDVEKVPGETWNTPAQTLHSIYQLEGLAWRKTAAQIKRTVNSLCMESLYVHARDRSVSLSGFLKSLEAALFPSKDPIQC